MLNLVRFWIVLSTLLVGGGWILSALHQLNRAGYAVILALLVLVILVWWKKSQMSLHEKLPQLWCKFQKRFRRRAPQLFLLIAALALLAGCLYPALNYDANFYRLPRVMHWLWAEQWHWIHTFDARMNISACGMEWLSAPLILFTHNDRALFLINWISYLMLPGLVFSVFTRLQVRPRVAWWWMWLLASGWCFALQAGSVSNDSFAAIYILAAVDLALRAREKKSVTDLWLSLLAAALVTGTKQTNIPLVALWFVAAWPARRLLWENPVGAAVAGCFGLLVSIGPISFLNYQHCGTWMPLKIPELTRLGSFDLNPFWGIIGNIFCIPIQNLLPPFYELIPPFYSYWLLLWNEMCRHFLQTSIGAHFQSFEGFAQFGVCYHGISESNASLGLGICLLIFASFRIMRQQHNSGAVSVGVPQNRFLFLLRACPWMLLVLFMAKDGAYENARHLAPYYAFLLPVLLVKSAQSLVVRHREWQRFAFLVMGCTVALVIASGERPLFPAKTILSALREQFPNNEFISGECERFIYGGSRNCEASRNYLQSKLPPGESPVGYMSLVCDLDEPGIWMPFGRRPVIDVLLTDSPDYLRAQGLKYIVADRNALPEAYLDRWLKQYNATIVGQLIFPNPEIKIPTPDIYLIRLN